VAIKGEVVKSQEQLREKKTLTFANDFYECLFLFINIDDNQRELIQKIKEGSFSVLIYAPTNKKNISIFVLTASKKTVVCDQPEEEFLADKLAARKAAEQVFRYIKKHFLGTKI
jgi:DNA-binding LacI/PurR family transcriptional regulator